MERLEQAITIAEAFEPLSDDAVRDLLAKTADAASRGEFELFKTSSVFDATAAHPDWLGEESERVQDLAPD